ncbi:MAG: YfjI family protein [Actinomycetota bacterium]|nr:YfjI family protein [Actinomycetota bacterium]
MTAQTQEEPPPVTTPAWEVPLPLSWSSTPPSFPVDALPETLGNYVKAKAQEVQTPVDLFAVPVLGVVAGAIGGRVRVKLRDGYEEPTNLFVVPVAPPSSRKSAAIMSCRVPLDEAERLIALNNEQGIRDATVQYDILAGRAAKAKEKAEKADTVSAIEDAQAAAREAAAAQPPTPTRLVIGDTTPERLGTLLCTHPCLAAISDEAGMLDSLAGRHAKKPNLDPILKAYTGARVDSETHVRGTEKSERPALTIVMSIQPFALDNILSGGEATGRGLTTRMLWALVPDIAGTRMWADSIPADKAITARYEKTIQDTTIFLVEAAKADKVEAAKADKDATPITLELDEDASKLIQEFHDEIEKSMRPDGPYGGGLIKEWVGKLTGTVGRIAAGLHVMSNPPPLIRKDDDGYVPPGQGAAGEYATKLGHIDKAAMSAAVKIGRYFLAHANVVFGREAPHSKEARELMAWLKTWLTDQNAKTFKVRDVQRNGPSHLRLAADLTPVLAHLVHLGHIRQTQEGPYEVYDEAKNAATPATAATTSSDKAVSAGQTVSKPGREVSQGSATPATESARGARVNPRLSQVSQAAATADSAPRGAATSANGRLSQVSQVSQPFRAEPATASA